MARNRYSLENYEKEHMARVIGRDLSISTKQAVEICSMIRNKQLQKAKEALGRVIDLKEAVPYKRFKKNIGHKRGNIAAGRYPIKSSKAILVLLKSVEANAQEKGLSTASLYIKHISANRAARPWHYGRHNRIKMKRTHVEIVVEERKGKEEKAKTPKGARKKVAHKGTEKEGKTPNAPKVDIKKEIKIEDKK